MQNFLICYRWKETVNRGGTRRKKLLKILEYVYNNFVNCIDTHAIIHNLDLRRWSLQANEEIGLENFKAFRHWIWNFKRTYRIVSRKVINLLRDHMVQISRS